MTLKKHLFYSLPPAGQKIPFKIFTKCLANTTQYTYDYSIENIKRYIGSENVLFMSSGRAALWLYLKALTTLRPDRKEVIIPAYTCPSVAAAVLNSGLRPVLCDNNMDDFGFVHDELEKKCGRQTLAVIVVHLYGCPANVDVIKSICENNDSYLIEDAAQAFGNTYLNEHQLKLGLKGDAGFYSFGRGKPINIMHGGLLVAKSKDIYNVADGIMRGLKNSEKTIRYYSSLGAYAIFSNPYLYWIPQNVPFLNLGGTIFEPNFEVTNGLRTAATLVSAMLVELEKEKEVRKMNAKWYSEHLTHDFINHGNWHGEYPYLRYPMIIKEPILRNRILDTLVASGAGATGSYPAPLNELPRLRNVLADTGEYSNAQKLSKAIITLPVHSNVKMANKEYMIRIIRQVSNAH